MILDPLLEKDVNDIEKQFVAGKVISDDAPNKEVARLIRKLIASHRLLKIRHQVATQEVMKILGEANV